MSYEYKGIKGPLKKVASGNGWFIDQDRDLGYNGVYVPINAGGDISTANATADLFTAAPELLSALIKATEDERYYISGGGPEAGWYKEAVTAIEKALNIKTQQS